MKRKSYIGGATCQNMIDAFQDRIDELEGNSIENSTKVDIKSATCEEMIAEFQNKIDELEGIETSTTIESADDIVDIEPEYIQGAEITNEYIDDLMSSVADEVIMPPYNSTCVWTIEDKDIVYILTQTEKDIMTEYHCPISDLTGDIDADISYILSSIPEDVV